jgi:hypothetical protein
MDAVLRKSRPDLQTTIYQKHTELTKKKKRRGKMVPTRTILLTFENTIMLE